MSHKPFGNITKDIEAPSINSSVIHSKYISSIEHIDTNVIAIEKDIYDLQDIAYHSTEEAINTIHELSNVQNDLIDLKYTQSLPWYCKSNFVYGEVQDHEWNNTTVPDSANQMFVRYVSLDDTYTGMILYLPKSILVGDSRHASVTPKSSEACVYIGMNPNDSVRLSSFDIEWMPKSEEEVQSGVLVGHSTLLSKPKAMGGFLFGSAIEPNSDNGQGVVLPDAGAFYIKTLYLDNNSGTSKIVMIGQKFQSTIGKTLPGFAYSGIQ